MLTLTFSECESNQVMSDVCIEPIPSTAYPQPGAGEASTYYQELIIVGKEILF